jgi:hypothetical protein
MPLLLNVILQHELGGSRWPPGLRRESVAVHLLELWVRIPPAAWMSLVNVVCSRVEVPATG